MTIKTSVPMPPPISQFIIANFCDYLVYILIRKKIICDIYSSGTWSPIIREIGTSIYCAVPEGANGADDPKGGQNGLYTLRAHAADGCLYGNNPRNLVSHCGRFAVGSHARNPAFLRAQLQCKPSRADDFQSQSPMIITAMQQPMIYP